MAGVVLATLCAATFASTVSDSARAEGTTVRQFAYTGTPQNFVVPDGVCQVTVDAFGGEGGTGENPDAARSPGGAGGRATSTIPVTAGETLRVYVGGRGDGRTGGFNGGGHGGNASEEDGGGGGGASDVRRAPYGLTDRVLVAGGGGGGGGDGGKGGGQGGGGGGTNGQDGAPATPGGRENGVPVVVGTPGGRGGTQAAGGGAPRAFDSTAGDGTFGEGGQGGVGPSNDDAGGGGGGGWYGGGGGAGEDDDVPTDEGGGGGGGSGYGPAGTTFETGSHAGHGYVEISYVPDEGCESFDWTVPKRFGFDKDGDGMVDYYPPSGSLVIEPDRWRVDFVHGDPADCDEELSRDWLIDGDSIDPADPRAVVYDPDSCEFSYEFPTEDTYDVQLVVYDADQNRVGSARQEVIVQDWLIVSVGDSVASGEGVPDRPLSPTLSQALWQSERCHRSANAGTAEAARNIENADDKTSVTFVHLACSGADIVKGLIQPYNGIVTGTGEPRPPAQIGHINTLIQERELDAILISIGANDIEFSTIVEDCVRWKDCHLLPKGKGKKRFDQNIAPLPNRFAALNALLTAPAGLPDVLPERFYLTEYYDPTRYDDFSVCGGLLPDGTRSKEVLFDHTWTGPLFGVREDEATWASQEMLPTLNQVVQNAANTHGWNYVGGIRGTFLQHGYCATDPYIVLWDGSHQDQADEKGTLHPNLLGHLVYANAIRDALRDDLYTDGDLSKPRKPATASE